MENPDIIRKTPWILDKGECGAIFPIEEDLERMFIVIHEDARKSLKPGSKYYVFRQITQSSNFGRRQCDLSPGPAIAWYSTKAMMNDVCWEAPLSTPQWNARRACYVYGCFAVSEDLNARLI